MAGKATFKQSDITRACKGALMAGLKVHSAEIDSDGKIRLCLSGPGDIIADNDAAEVNKWTKDIENTTP